MPWSCRPRKEIEHPAYRGNRPPTMLAAKLQNEPGEEIMKMATLAVTASMLWGAAALAGMAQAAEIKVLGTPGVREFYAELVAQFEKESGHRVSTAWAGTVD